MLCMADFAAKKRAFSVKPARRIFLREDLELSLRVRKILLPVISLRQLHPDIGNERGCRILLEKLIGDAPITLRGVGVWRGVLDPDDEIIGPFAGGGARARSSGRSPDVFGAASRRAARHERPAPPAPPTLPRRVCDAGNCPQERLQRSRVAFLFPCAASVRPSSSNKIAARFLVSAALAHLALSPPGSAT